jgi:hypothetical protein
MSRTETAASAKQVNLLKNLNYTEQQIESLDRKQAGALINNIRRNGWRRVEWVSPGDGHNTSQLVNEL